MSEPSESDRERQLRHAVAVGPFPPIQYWGDEVKFVLRLLDVARAEVAAAREEGRREADDAPNLEAWEPDRINREVDFAISAAGRLRREEREVAFAIEISRLRTVIRAARDDLVSGDEASAYLVLKHSGVP